MIRLKASELCLTQTDITETQRRMERRQAANVPATLPARVHGPPMPPGFGARLRRGPKRSRDDAVATLGNIPILRPQQASTEDPRDVSRPIRDSFTGSSEAVSSQSTSPSFQDDQTTLDSGSPARLTLPLPGREVQLPFRPTPLDLDLRRFAPQEETTEEASSPAKHQLRTPGLGQARTNSSETGNDETSPSFMHGSTDGHVDGAPALETPVRPDSHRQNSSHAPSPLQHEQRIASPGQRGFGVEQTLAGNDPRGTFRNEQPTAEVRSPRFIRGYWDSHHRYRFMECAPRTEPRPRTQPIRHSRAISSNSEPSYQRRPDTSESSLEDIFGGIPAPEPSTIREHAGTEDSTESSNDRYWSPLGSDGMGYGDPIRTTFGRSSSGTSTASQPYSFYELPDSQHSSSSHSQQDLLAQAQYDGAAPCRQSSRGAYYSIRLPQSRAASGAHPRQPPPSRASSTSSPDLSALFQHTFSPLPARPYSRPLSASAQHMHSLIPSTGLISAIDMLGGDQDAARAVQRDLSSPLELVQERANAYFQRIQTRLQAAPLSRAADPREHPDRRRRTSSSGSSRQDSGNGARGRMSVHPRTSMRYPPVLLPAPSEPAFVRTRVPQGARRAVPTARAGQRSSENVPVGQSAQEVRPTRMPTRGASLEPRPTPPSSSIMMRGGEFPTSPVMVRFSMPQQVPRPRDVSNRPHMHSPHPLLLSSDDDPSSSDTLTPVPNPTRLAPPPHAHGPHSPLRHTSRHDPSPSAHRPFTIRAVTPIPSPSAHHPFTIRAVTPIPAPLPFSRQRERGLPSTSTTLDNASGLTSRRAHAARMATSRRRALQDQENSEERETEDMRGESAQVEWRLGRGDVMDETPPRVGRYERFLFN